jgi:ankyrin repeat protein
MMADLQFSDGNDDSSGIRIASGHVRDDDDYVLMQVKELMSRTIVDELVRVLNENGYNALQVAVMNDDLQVVEVLVENGWDVNFGHCSLPLHVAALRGNLPIIDLLLTRGHADPSLLAGMCHPHPHHPIHHVPSRFHFLETDMFACDSSRGTALWYALTGDNVRVLQHLNVSPGEALRNACRVGATCCAHYLATIVTVSDLNAADADGMTPLLHAVHSGRQFFGALVDAGANVHARDIHGRTALHVLLAPLVSENFNAATALDSCRYLLACGLESQASAQDVAGNTALHLAIDLVNRRSSDPVSHEVATLEIIRTLLEHNCDADCRNSAGVTALHRLLLTFDFVAGDDPTGVTPGTLSMRENYHADAGVLRRAVEVLLLGGASPRLATGAGRTPLELILACLLGLDPGHMTDTAPELVACLALLCSFGARPSADDQTHAAVVWILAQLGRRCLGLRDNTARESMSLLIADILALLIHHGLDSNRATSQRQRPNGNGGVGGVFGGTASASPRTGNILVEIVRLAADVRSPADLVHLHHWALACLHHGADPDVEPYPADDVICHSQSSIFIRPKATQPVLQYVDLVADLVRPLGGGGGAAERLLMLFYNSMSHAELFRCLRAAAADRRPSQHSIMRVVARLASQPRSLKQNARVAVYVGLGRQLETGVPQLPLPPSLQRYLLNVE